MTEETVVRENLMTRQGYSPYCGDDDCPYGNPRTEFSKTKGQFICPCGWESQFPHDFIERYKVKWDINS